MSFRTSHVDWKINADDGVPINVLPTEHAVYFALGAGTLYRVDDRDDLGSLDLPPIQRAVIVARLRAIADLIEAAPA